MHQDTVIITFSHDGLRVLKLNSASLAPSDSRSRMRIEEQLGVISVKSHVGVDGIKASLSPPHSGDVASMDPGTLTVRWGAGR